MISQTIVDQIKYCFEKNHKVMFLVGAGISAESGIPTFRGKDGYWVVGSKNYKAQEIGTKRFFNIASDEVLKFYLYRKSITNCAVPNESHTTLRDIEDLLKDHFVLVSQNVDGLHKKTGSTAERTYLIHGDHDYMRCGDDCTDDLYPFPLGIQLERRFKDLLTPQEMEMLKCPKCGEGLRPHVLWFNEYYNEKFYKVDSVLSLARRTKLLFIMGTSGATTLPKEILNEVIVNDGLVVEVNPEVTEFTDWISTYENGMVIKDTSTVFLQDLKSNIDKLV